MGTSQSISVVWLRIHITLRLAGKFIKWRGWRVTVEYDRQTMRADCGCAFYQTAEVGSRLLRKAPIFPI
ncbi:MAG: hypothetical protein WCI02_18410 [Planctomycetota bacterium]